MKSAVKMSLRGLESRWRRPWGEVDARSTLETESLGLTGELDVGEEEEIGQCTDVLLE